MVIKQLIYIAALARERHFGRAAKSCNISQPTLSASLRQLENELGAPIVERGQRFNGFTPEGDCVLDYAKRIIAECEALKQDLGKLKGGLVGKLRLGVIPTALPIVPLVTAPFHAAHPLVTIAVLSHPSAEIQRGIEEFNLDVGITYMDIDTLGQMKLAPLYREEYLLLIPEKGPLGERKTMTWVEAAELPLCLLMPGMQNCLTVDAAFRSVGRQPRPAVEKNSIFNLRSYVSTGHGAGIVPKALLQAEGVPEGTRALALVEPVVTRSIGLIIADREPASPLARSMFAVATALNIEAQLAQGLKGGFKPRARRVRQRLG